MEMKKKGLDREMIISCGIIALVASTGILFGTLFLLGIDVANCNSAVFVSLFSVLSAVIWGILLCRNC